MSATKSASEFAKMLFLGNRQNSLSVAAEEGNKDFCLEFHQSLWKMERDVRTDFILSKPYKWLKRCERRHKHNCIYLYKQSGTQESVVEARRLVYM